MPCGNADYGPSQSASLSARDIETILDKKLKDREDESDRVTRYLCAVLDDLRRRHLDEFIIYQSERVADEVRIGEIYDWWKNHRSDDDKRNGH